LIASLIVVFREVLEAGLIVGIVLAATAGVPRRGLWVAGGIGAGVLGAAIVAGFAGALAEALQGVGQEVFTATILILAVLMLGWHTIWMASHGREMSIQLKAAGEAVRLGEKTLLALAIVVAIAVLREGSEVVLFLYGIAVSTHEGLPAMLAGGLAGLALAACVSWLLYRGLLIIPMRHLFGVTNVLIALLAAGMAGQAAAVLAGADILPSWGDQIWNVSWIVSDDSLLGRSLHALVGYSARPSGIQIVTYIATLATLIGLSRLVGAAPRKNAGVNRLSGQSPASSH
jgi:high-affinity iron transporter